VTAMPRFIATSDHHTRPPCDPGSRHEKMYAFALGNSQQD